MVAVVSALLVFACALKYVESHVHCLPQAAGLKHIGFGPFKRENQDEFFIQVGEFGGLHSSNLFCVFDGHGTYGKDAALYSRQLLPRLLDVEMTKYFQVRAAVWESVRDGWLLLEFLLRQQQGNLT